MAGKKCKNCHYRRPISGANQKNNTYCAYISMTGERRPCEPDNMCIAYAKRGTVKTKWAEA